MAVQPGSRTIYLIEDDPSVRRAMKRLLEAAGYAVETFAGAGEFLDFPFRKRGALVILDIHLLEADGIALQEKLLHTGIGIPVIFLTACDNGEKRNAAGKLGAEAYFRKPVDGHALVDAIELAFSRRR